MSVPLPLWPDTGFEHLERTSEGRLRITDRYLASWLERPELAPVPASCAAERALHAAFREDPRLPITPVTLLRLRDRDVRENWELFVRFRDHLLAHGTVEEAYLALFTEDGPRLPQLFADELARLVACAVLAEDPHADAFRLRAAELLFRPQQVAIVDGAVLLADVEAVRRRSELQGAAAGFSLARLARSGGPDLPVLRPHNAARYLAETGSYGFVLDLSFGGEGLDAFCRVLEGWVRHFFSIEVEIQPLARVRDERWRWHIGLDAESSALLDDLYRGAEVGEERLSRLLALMRLDFRDPSVVIGEMRGRPVYLGLAMDGSGRLRAMPQNLLVNLPVRLVG